MNPYGVRAEGNFASLIGTDREFGKKYAPRLESNIECNPDDVLVIHYELRRGLGDEELSRGEPMRSSVRATILDPSNRQRLDYQQFDYIFPVPFISLQTAIAISPGNFEAFKRNIGLPKAGLLLEVDLVKDVVTKKRN